MPKMVSMDRVRDVLSIENVGEGFHTAFRKCDAVPDMKVWNAIRDMPNDQWTAVIAWVVGGLLRQIEPNVDDKPLETRFTLVLRPDTTDPEEAHQDALDFIAASKDGWYSGIRLEGQIIVYERADDE